MFELLQATVKPLMLDSKILEVAYELYLKAPQESHPLINLKELSYKTGTGLLECRNTIVEANKLGKFPDCRLQS
jgi:hypothetical protein